MKSIQIIKKLLALSALVALASPAFAQEEGTNEKNTGLRLAESGQAPVKFIARTQTEKSTYLGVAVANVDETLRAQLKLAKGAGLKIEEVSPSSPADKAGLKAHDVLEKLNDQLLFNTDQLTSLVRSLKPGDQVTLSIIREGKARTIEATLAEKELPKTVAGIASNSRVFSTLKNLQDNYLQHGLRPPLQEFKFQGQAHLKPVTFLGVEAKPVDAGLAAQLALEDGEGVLVGTVVEKSPAEKAGLKTYDVLVKLDGEAIKGPAELVKLIQSHKSGDQIKLVLMRGGKRQEVEITLSQKDNPEPTQFKSLLQQYRVVPKVEIIQDPKQKEHRIVVLKSENDGAGGASVSGTVSTAHVVTSSGQPGSSTSTVTVWDGAHEKSVTHHSPSQSTTSSSTSHSSSGEKTVVAHATGSTTGKTSSDVMMLIKSDLDTITVQGKDGNRQAIVKDLADKIIFDGPVNTEEEKAKLPANIRERIEKIETQIRTKSAAPPKVEELKILNTKTARIFI